MEGLSKNKSPSKEPDPYLESLWDEYDFSGKPPFAGSVAEQRLREACEKYANLMDSQTNIFPGSGKDSYGIKKISSSESDRRVLHNQIAIMTMGTQRTGMDSKLAEKISDFAYEYIKGYKIGEAYKYKNAGNGDY
jgi:hypothetical protein